MASRFATPVTALRLQEVLRRQRRTWWWALVLAGVVHALVLWIDPIRPAPRAAERPAIRFIERTPAPPRVVPRRPRPANPRRSLSRTPMAVPSPRLGPSPAAGSGRLGIGMSSGGAGKIGVPRAEGLAVPLGDGSQSPATGLAAQPGLQAPPIATQRDADQRVDLTLEMLDMKSLAASGRYWSLVVQDSTDRQKLRGFVRLARVAGSSESGRDSLAGELSGLASGLKDNLNSNTALRVEYRTAVDMGDPELLQIPILIGPLGTPTEIEMEQLARYLLSGGFVIGDVVDAYAEALQKYGHLIEGRDFYKQRLPRDHVLFSSFFELPGNPCLIGHFVNERLAGVTECGAWVPQGPTRRLQVNIVVYALTQRGSITQRLMSRLRPGR